MPKIPVYEQGQLASAAVGTPGVNTAGATAWNALATEADKVTNTMLEISSREARKKQAELDAIAKEQKQLNDEGVLVENLAQFRVHEAEILGKGQTDFAENPTDFPSFYQKEAAAALQKREALIQDPLVRQKFHNKGLQQISERYDTITKESAAKGSLLLTKRMDYAFDTQALLENGDEPEKFTDRSVKYITDNLDAIVKAYGVEAPAKIREFQQDAFENMLAGMINKGDYAGAQRILEQTDTSGFMSEDEKLDFRSSVNEAVKRADSVAKIQASDAARKELYDVKLGGGGSAEIEGLVNKFQGRVTTSTQNTLYAAAEQQRRREQKALEKQTQTGVKDREKSIREGLRVSGAKRNQFSVALRDANQTLGALTDQKTEEGYRAKAATLTKQLEAVDKQYYAYRASLSSLGLDADKDPNVAKMRAERDSLLGKINSLPIGVKQKRGKKLLQETSHAAMREHNRNVEIDRQITRADLRGAYNRMAGKPTTGRDILARQAALDAAQGVLVKTLNQHPGYKLTQQDITKALEFGVAQQLRLPPSKGKK